MPNRFIFFEFKKKDFEQNIISSLKKLSNFNEIFKSSSTQIYGMQLADTCAGVLRKHLSGDETYFKKIESKTRIVREMPKDCKIQL